MQTIKRHTGHQMMGDADFAMLIGLAFGQKNIGKLAVEIGTLHGITTVNLARVLPNHKIITVSMPKDATPVLNSTPSDADFFGIIPAFEDDVKDRIEHMPCDSADLELPNAPIGFAFIDGGHSVEYVVNDFHKVLPLMAQGGLIVFHDYGIDNSCGITAVKTAVDSLADKYPNYDWMTMNGIPLAWVRVL